MWSKQNEKMKLNLNSIRSDFRIISQDGIHLVCPKKNLWDWESEEIWLRSLVVDDDGFVVSSGWPKFGNYGEFQNDTKTLNAILKTDEEVLYTLKEDGSLCIRSVINGKVVFRTRGTLFGGVTDVDGNESFGVRFQRVAKDLYPKLLDATWQCDKSLLFEYVSPDNKIVIRYSDADLIFLGFINHANLSMGSWNEVSEIAKVGSLHLVELHELPRDPIKLLEEIRDWDDEGIVARCNNSQTLVKIKSANYLYKHRIKYSMKYSFVVEFVKLAGIENEKELVDALTKDDLDYEIVTEGVNFYRQYVAVLDQYESHLSVAKAIHSAFLFWFNNEDEIDEKEKRKKYASFVCSQHQTVRSLAFALYKDKKSSLKKICHNMVISEGKK